MRKNKHRNNDPGFKQPGNPTYNAYFCSFKLMFSQLLIHNAFIFLSADNNKTNN